MRAMAPARALSRLAERSARAVGATFLSKKKFRPEKKIQSTLPEARPESERVNHSLIDWISTLDEVSFGVRDMTAAVIRHNSET